MLTKRDLESILADIEHLPDDTEIRFASQPNHPLEISIRPDVRLASDQGLVEDGEPDVVYLVEERQIGYAPRALFAR